MVNDAQLIQNVRSALGRSEAFKGSGCINVSSCGAGVTLHGIVRREEDRRIVEAVARGISGVRGVENGLRVGVVTART